MYEQENTSQFTQIVDYIWDRKVRFLIAVAALFFAIHGITVAVDSIKNPVTVDRTVENAVVGEIGTATSTVAEIPRDTEPVATAPVVRPQQNSASSAPAVKPVSQTAAASVSVPTVGVLPTRIIIEKYGVDSTISNPSTTNIDKLNDILTRAVVRYPGSGTMTSGNMLIMGHSSELPVIRNAMYKVFAQLKYMKAGDEIKVYSGTSINTYKVTAVNMLSINDDQAYIPFSSNSHMLTLVTCNVRGAKDQRYIVSAEFVGTTQL